ncbi:MAG TPA: hypothetical protein VHG08_00865 [Longimicrobium sp.]|nr:hypothetical protein [Longimicrobium sp.]
MKSMPATLDSPAAPNRRRPSLLARLRHWLENYDAPTREEAWRRINSKPGFLSSLSPEALEYIKNYDGPENMGPPHPRR